MKIAGKTFGIIGGIIGIVISLLLTVTVMSKISYSPTFGAFYVNGKTFKEMTEGLEETEKDRISPENYTGQRWLSEFKEFEEVMENYMSNSIKVWNDWKKDAAGELKVILIIISSSFFLSIFGIVGGSLCNKHNIVGGIFMIISGLGIFIGNIFALGAALSWIAVFMWVVVLFFFLGGIFAVAAKN